MLVFWPIRKSKRLQAGCRGVTHHRSTNQPPGAAAVQPRHLVGRLLGGLRRLARGRVISLCSPKKESVRIRRGQRPGPASCVPRSQPSSPRHPVEQRVRPSTIIQAFQCRVFNQLGGANGSSVALGESRPRGSPHFLKGTFPGGSPPWITSLAVRRDLLARDTKGPVKDHCVGGDSNFSWQRSVMRSRTNTETIETAMVWELPDPGPAIMAPETCPTCAVQLPVGAARTRHEVASRHAVSSRFSSFHQTDPWAIREWEAIKSLPLSVCWFSSPLAILRIHGSEGRRKSLRDSGRSLHSEGPKCSRSPRWASRVCCPMAPQSALSGPS
jgi:hypothetical protein